MTETKTFLIAVACRNSSGSADMPLFEVEVTQEGYDLGEHYELAESKAEDAGYEAPFLCYDHSEHSAIVVAAERLRPAA